MICLTDGELVKTNVLMRFGKSKASALFKTDERLDDIKGFRQVLNENPISVLRAIMKKSNQEETEERTC